MILPHLPTNTAPPYTIFYFAIEYLFLLELFERINRQLAGIVLDENDHHQCYLGIGLALSRNPFIKEAMSNIHGMSHPLLRPLFLNEAEVNASPREVLAQDFLEELGIDSECITSSRGERDHLKTSIRNAMNAANFSQTEINDITSYLFDSPDKNFAPFAPTGNENARALGFPNFESFHAGITIENYDARLKHYTFKVTPSSLVETAKTCPLLLTDEPAFFYRKLLAQFCKACKARRRGAFSSDDPAVPPLLHPRIGEIANRARRNAIRLLTHQPETVSLNRLAEQEFTLERFITRKKACLILKGGAKRVIPKDQLSTFNCFLCPPTVPNEPVIPPTEIHESLAEYTGVDPSVPYINYKRILPYNSAREILSHIFSEHLRSPTAESLSEQRCSMVIPCKTCLQLHMADPDQNPLESAFVCCAQCALDHSKILHSSSNKLLALYTSLEADFQHNSWAKEALERHLLTQCFSCGALFKNNAQMRTHQHECIASFMSLCSGYGRPLASEIFFTSAYIKRKEHEQMLCHATDRLSQLVKTLQSKVDLPLQNDDDNDDDDPLLEQAASLLSTIASPPSRKQSNKKGKEGKRGTPKSTKVARSRLPPGLESSDEEVEVSVEPVTTATTNDNDDSSLRRRVTTEIEEDDVWIEAEQNRRIALLQSSPPHVRLSENGDVASTVLKAEIKQPESSLPDDYCSLLDNVDDHYCSPPPAKKKHTTL